MAISLVTPHEFRALNKIQKIAKLTLKEIPSLEEIKSKEIKKILDKISSIDPTARSIEIVESLQNEYDLFTIATKFATLLFKDESSKDKIGKSIKEAKRLLNKTKNKRRRRY